jgi:hypothetical protein
VKSNFVFNLIQGIFTLAGAGMIIGGYFAAPGSLTDDGFPLDRFLYLMGGFFILWPLLLFGTIKYFMRRAAVNIQQLKDQGIKGKARVLHMRRTNVTINNIPQVVLDLSITTSLGQKFETAYKKCIDPIYYSLIRPDADLPVYVDPNNQKKIYVDFEEAWAKAGEKKPGFGF